MDYYSFKLRNIKKRNVANINRRTSLGYDEFEDECEMGLGSLFEEEEEKEENEADDRSSPRRRSVPYFGGYMSNLVDNVRRTFMPWSYRTEESEELDETEQDREPNSLSMKNRTKAKTSVGGQDTIYEEFEDDDDANNDDDDNDDDHDDDDDDDENTVLTDQSKHKKKSEPDYNGSGPPTPPPIPPVHFKSAHGKMPSSTGEGSPIPKPPPPPAPPLPSSQQGGMSADGGQTPAQMTKERVLGLDHLRRESFHKDVAKKTKVLLIGQSDAEIEVLMDRLQAEHRTKEAALLYVVKNVFPESKVESLVTALLQRGATPTECDEEGCSTVYHAVSRGFTQVLRKLLETKAVPYGQDKYGMTPLKIALDKRNDDMCALLVAFMPNRVVRSYFCSIAGKAAELNFHDLLRSNMEQTILGVLDSLMDPTPNQDFKVHFHILECDENGRSPRDSTYDSTGESAVHVIAATGNKDAVFHDAVRLLLRRKWKCYARTQFMWNGIRYIFSLIALTFALVVGIEASDPLVYDTPLQHARGAAELYCCINTIFHLFIELSQLYRSRLDYWQSPFNLLDFSAILLLLAVIPLRFTATMQSWPVFGVGYFLWTMRTFKYSAITRSTGAFAQILWGILTKDIVQFVAVFLVVLLAFSGMFLTALKYEGDSYQHWETKSFWVTLLTGTRTLVEQQPIVDYVGEGGYGPLSVIVMMLFLFATLVVLLNILIARLSDTYQNVQSDAQRGLELDRAWIITRMERHSFFFDYRKTHYKEVKIIGDLHEKLEKWESPPVSDRTRMLVELQEKMENQDVYLRSLGHRLHVTQRMSHKIQTRLADIEFLLKKLLAGMEKDDASADNNKEEH